MHLACRNSLTQFELEVVAKCPDEGHSQMEETLACRNEVCCSLPFHYRWLEHARNVESTNGNRQLKVQLIIII